VVIAMRCQINLIGVLLALLWQTTSAHCEDWPTYRHDRLRTGVTGEKLALPLQPIWTFTSRQHRRAPVPAESPTRAHYPDCARFTLPMIAVGDAVYFGSAADGRVVCLEAASGKVRWQFVAGAGINRTPMFADARIYAGSDDGHVYCLDAADGKLVWKFRAAPAERCFLAYGRMISAWPVQTDVLADDGVAYFAAGVFPHEGTFLYALDAQNGELLWRNGTQCENGHQLSLAPGGHLFVTGRDIWVPKDFRGYSKPYYGSPTPFLRADGRFVNGFGSSTEEDPERPKIEGGVWDKFFWPLMGVEKGGIRYAGATAWRVQGEEKARETLWQHPTPDRWVDFDSGVGVRGKHDTFCRYDPDLSSVIYAGDTVFHTAFDADPAKGVGSGIYARDPKDGRVLWAAEIAERANQLVAANGRLLVGSRRGTITCYAPKGTPAHGAIEEPIDAAPFVDENEKLVAAAETIIEQSGIRDGYVLVLDCQSGRLAYELASRTNMIVCAAFSDEQGIVRAREAYANADVHLSRIIAFHVAAQAALPFPSYFADLIVSESAAAGGPLPGNVEELARVQKPIRGVALIGGEQTEDSLKQWSTAAGQTGWNVVEADGHWLRRTRPPLDDAGGWTHMHADPGNTLCSHDGVLKPPLGVAWYGTPQIEQPATHTALVVDGILVVPQPNALEACDQYTGRRLWRMDAGSIGLSVAASRTHVYAKVAHVLAQIDLHTGKEAASYLSAFGKEHPWGWFAVADDGKTVFGAAGGGLFATEMASGKGNVRWTLGGPEADETDKIGGLTAMSDGRIYVLGPAADDQRRRDTLAAMRRWMQTQPPELLEEFESQLDQRDVRTLTAVDAATGKVLYRRGVDVSNCGGAWLREKGRGYGSKRHYNPGVGMGLYARANTVVVASESLADKGWGMFNSGAYDARAITAVDGPTGKLLWYKFTNHRTRPVIVDGTVYAEPWAFDLRSGEKKTRLHPITGEPADWAWCRGDKQCGIFSASRHFLFGRNKGFGYHDLLRDDGLYTFWHSRSNCYVDHTSGGGLMIKPPQAVYCQCQWSLPFTVAMGQVSTLPAAAPMFGQPGPSLPVKHLYLDLGAAGDRRDRHGRLWLTSNRPVNHRLLLGYGLECTMYEGGEAVRRSAPFTSIEGTDVPFVFASALVGLQRCQLPLASAEEGKRTYCVRLGFAAMPGDAPGRRVFDVILDGRKVLEDFDPSVAAGGADRAVWKAFDVDAQRQLVLELVPQSNTTEIQRLPVIQALQVLRR